MTHIYTANLFSLLTEHFRGLYERYIVINLEWQR